MKTNRFFRIIFCLLLFGLFLQTNSEAEDAQLKDSSQGASGIVGFAIITDDGRFYGRNADTPFPLLSVFKLHVAAAVLDKMRQKKLSLDTPLKIPASKLIVKTYSPMRDKYGLVDITLPIKDILQYMISLSDNNACDAMIEYAGGLQAVEEYIRKQGLRSTSLGMTEKDMMDNIYNQYANIGTPRETATLMLNILGGKAKIDPYDAWLLQCLRQTATGKDKLAGGIPKNARLGHKTGSSSRGPTGVKFADNDLGIFQLPDGKNVAIAVFVQNSLAGDDENAAAIAKIGRWAYDKLVSPQ